MAAQPLHWNIETLKDIKLDPVPRHELEGQKIIDIWKDTLCKYASEEDKAGRKEDAPDEDGFSRIEGYIRVLYGLGRSAFNLWPMYPESVESTKDLIEAIFRRMEDNIKAKSRGAEDEAKSYLAEMSEATKWCPDRQMAAFNMIYSALYFKTDVTDSFESFVKNEIASAKNYIFEMTVTPPNGTQNVHVLNHWKFKLRDELGFNTEYTSRIGTFQQDMFGNHDGNALQAFYRKFTPDYMIGRLTEAINNSKQKMLNDSAAFLHKEMGDMERARLLFNFKDEESVEDMLYHESITSEGVEEILVKMGILVRNEEVARD